MNIIVALIAYIPLVWGAIDCGNKELAELGTCLDAAFQSCGNIEPSVAVKIDVSKALKIAMFGICMVGKVYATNGAPLSRRKRMQQHKISKRQPNTNGTVCNPWDILGQQCGLPPLDLEEATGNQMGPLVSTIGQTDPLDNQSGILESLPPFLNNCKEEVMTSLFGSKTQSDEQCLIDKTHQCIVDNKDHIETVMGCNFAPKTGEDSCPVEFLAIINECSSL